MASFYENISGYIVTNTDRAYFTDIDVSNSMSVGGVTVDLAALANIVDTSVFSGVISSQGLDLDDDKYIKIGTGNDLEIFHDGDDSYIRDVGTGDLRIQGTTVSLQNLSGGTLLSTTATGIDVTGTVTADGVSLEAGDKLIFGAEANSSLQIYEDDDGGKSRIAQYGGGDLWIQGENISLRNDDAETLIGTGHIQAFMYWQGDTGTKGERLRTTDSGIDVTGDVAANTVTVGDSTGSNLELYEDGSQNAIIRQRGTGGLQISGVNGSLANDDHEQLVTWDADNVNLSWQGASGAGTKLSTTQTGINVTGTITADGVSLGDNEQIQLGASGDLKIYHNGSHSKIEDTGTGNLVIEGTEVSIKDSDGNRRVYSENGSTGAAFMYYGEDGAYKFRTTATGIDVAGTVAASDGLTADYIDLTGGKTTTSTGTICADEIRFSAHANDEAKIYATVDSLNTSLMIQSNDDLNDKVRVVAGGTESLTVTRSGIAALGFKVGGSSYMGGISTNLSSSATSTTLATSLAVKNYVDAAANVGTLAQTLASGNSTGGNDIVMGLADTIRSESNAPVLIKHSATQFTALQSSGGYSRVLATDTSVSLGHGVNAGAGGTKLQTTATGVDVTGTVEADNFLVDTGGYIAFEGAGSTDFASIRTVIDNDNGITNLDFRLGDDDADAFRWQFNHFNDGDTDYDTYMQLRADTSNPNKGVLTVTGTVDANAFTGHMTSVVSSTAQTIATTSYGVRKIHTGGAVAYTFNATGAISGTDIGKAIVIANAGTDTITCNFTTSKFYKMISGVNSDLSGSGLASITIAKGGIAEIVITQTNKALVFGAGVA